MYWKYHTQTLYDITLCRGIASFALQKILHPHFMKSIHHFYDITPTIFDIVSTLFLSPHPLYWWYHTNSIYEISSSIYVDIISIVYKNLFTILYHHSHCTCVSHTHFPWYHTLCIYDIACTIWLTSDTLYKVSFPQFMTSRHIIYDISCTVFMSSLPRYLTLHPLYLCHHKHSIYDLWKIVYDNTPTIYMTSYASYIMSHPLFQFTPM